MNDKRPKVDGTLRRGKRSDWRKDILEGGERTAIEEVERTGVGVEQPLILAVLVAPILAQFGELVNLGRFALDDLHEPPWQPEREEENDDDGDGDDDEDPVDVLEAVSSPHRRLPAKIQ